MTGYHYQANDDGSVTLFLEGGDERGHTFDPDQFPNLERDYPGIDWPNLERCKCGVTVEVYAPCGSEQCRDKSNDVTP